MIKDTKVSIIDVSKRAGVSPMTVSRVIRNNSYVSTEARSKVLSAVKELGYVPSQSARALRNGNLSLSDLKTCCGLIFGWETQDSISFFSDIARSVEKEAMDNGLCLLQTHWQNEFEGSWKRLASIFSVPGLCGLILAGQFSADEVNVIQKYCKNIVIIDGAAPSGVNVPCVEADYDAGSKLAIQHLASVGANRVLILTGPCKEHYFAKSVKKAASLNSEKFSQIDIEYIDMTVESGVRLVKERFSNSKPYDAIFTNDEVSLGIMKVLSELGFKVPEDVKIMGFDNIPYSKYSTPGLSTIHIDKISLGREAIKTLMESLNSDNRTDISNVKKIVQASLVVRESTGR